MLSKINVIVLDQKWTNCAVCRKETRLGYSIPMYEGRKVDITKTDEWAGMPVCQECYLKAEGKGVKK